jgi:hypothetical protein
VPADTPHFMHPVCEDRSGSILIAGNSASAAEFADPFIAVHDADHGCGCRFHDEQRPDRFADLVTFSGMW